MSIFFKVTQITDRIQIASTGMREATLHRALHNKQEIGVKNLILKEFNWGDRAHKTMTELNPVTLVCLTLGLSRHLCGPSQ